jgi:hypothetical protein
VGVGGPRIHSFAVEGGEALASVDAAVGAWERRVARW